MTKRTERLLLYGAVAAVGYWWLTRAAPTAPSGGALVVGGQSGAGAAPHATSGTAHLEEAFPGAGYYVPTYDG